MGLEKKLNENSDKLRILHLSDIHFKEPDCHNLDTDPEHPVRKALVNNIRDRVETLGSIDAILVSGDIAFKGHPEEYNVAYEWLKGICDVSGCHPKSIFTVPGNHDVDRNAASEKDVLRVRGLIEASQSGPERDQRMHDTLLDVSAGSELYVPMKNYNRFAASFDCDLFPKRPFWIAELPLAPGWVLKMHGLTSTFLSGPEDDVKGGLYLGAFQRSFSPDDGVVHLVIQHHPPSWLEDGEELEDSLDNCVLHLMGHRHLTRHRATDLHRAEERLYQGPDGRGVRSRDRPPGRGFELEHGLITDVVIR